MNLRNAVIQNLENSSFEDIHSTIDNAINSKEENILPGLGVFFELIWNSANNSEKQSICEKVTNLVTK